MQNSSPVKTRFADPTPLGLFGLAIGCAALLPLAFGMREAFAPDALRFAAWFCLLFGAGCQMLAGLMSFANHNGLGGTLLTAFSFNWVMNFWSLHEIANGRLPNPAIVLCVDACFLAIFCVMTFAFGFFSRIFVLFVVDVDVLYVLRIIKQVGHQPGLALPIAIATLVLMLLALYIASSLVLAQAMGRIVLPLGGPLWSFPKVKAALPALTMSPELPTAQSSM